MRLYVILMSMLQSMGFTSKTYSLFRKIPHLEYKRKGHRLHNPTDSQVLAMEEQLIRKAKIDQWIIYDSVSAFPSKWDKRHTNVIDTLVVGSIDSPSWSSQKLYAFDTSIDNNVIYGKPLPGISYHLFINSSGMVEKIASYNDIVYHTKGINARSIGIGLQHLVTGNSAPPNSKILTALIRTLTILCLEFKLNPYKAIKGQREVHRTWWPGAKGHTTIQDMSPSLLISMDEIRRNVAVKMKYKLTYSGLYPNVVHPTFDNKMKHATNVFDSNAIAHLYQLTSLEKIKL